MNENVTVCITPKGEKPVLHFSQFDNENVFTVTVLADDGESAAVLTGLDIEFRLRKTDSHVVTIAPESVADNVITFKTTEQLCACCGQNIASVVLMKDDMNISTLDILVDIQRDILSGGLTSESDIRNLTTQIEQIVPEVLGDDYYTKTEVDELIDDIPTFDPTNYYDKSDVDGLLADKADSDDVMTKVTRHGLGGDVSYYSFDNNCVSPMDNLECAVEAVQDLHGYSKPWCGGGGKNLLNNPDKTTTGASYVINNVNVPMVAGNYMLSFDFSGTSSSSSLRIDDENGTAIFTTSKTITSGYNEYLINISSNASFVKLFSNAVGTYTKFQIERGNQFTSYEPYSNICPISGHSSCTITVADSDNTPVNTCTVSFGQTIYGGDADITGGKVTKENGFITCDGSENWQVSGSGSGQIFYLLLPDMVSGLNLNGITNYIPTGSNTSTFCIRFGYNSTYVFIYQAVDTLGVSDLASFKTYLSNNPLEILYPLATPAEVTFPPATTDTINGTNKVSSSTGNMKSLTYFSDVNSDLVDLIRACMI